MLSKSVPLSDEDMIERKVVLCEVAGELCSLRDRTVRSDLYRFERDDRAKTQLDGKEVLAHVYSSKRKGRQLLAALVADHLETSQRRYTTPPHIERRGDETNSNNMRTRLIQLDRKEVPVSVSIHPRERDDS